MKTYLKEHQAEAFKKIAEAIGKENVFVSIKGFNKACYCPHEFNPLENAEQWIECLMWYKKAVWNIKEKEFEACCEMIDDAIESREALLVAILEMIGER